MLSQGVDTRTCTILTAATRLGDPCILWKMGVAHQSHRVTEVFPVRSCGHSQILGGNKLVAAVSIAHIGVTTPCHLPVGMLT